MTPDMLAGGQRAESGKIVGHYPVERMSSNARPEVDEERALGTTIFVDGVPVPSRDFVSRRPSGGTSVYEVLRVIDGTPLFLTEHLQRLESSGRRECIEIRDDSTELAGLVRRLVQESGVATGNVKLIVNQDNGATTTLVYFIPHRYPSAEEYRFGVRVATLKRTRQRPGSKSENRALRRDADGCIAKRGVYEVLFVNDAGFVTEGSRSNVFLIQGDVVRTPPVATVLPGITRAKVVSICRELGVRLIEQRCHYRDLSAMQALFLTGTSPKVLPVASVDDITFGSPNPLLRAIMDGYDAMVTAYLAQSARRAPPGAPRRTQ